jgi:hypothetical protein
MPPLTIRFDDEIEAKLRKEAEAASVTISDLVRQLVVDGLDRRPKKLSHIEAYHKHFEDWSDEEPDDEPDLADNTEEALRKIFDAKRRLHR